MKVPSRSGSFNSTVDLACDSKLIVHYETATASKFTNFVLFIFPRLDHLMGLAACIVAIRLIIAIM
jgi:hypothetical protein